MALYDATGGDSWNSNTNWKSDRPISEWHGVTVDTDGRVTRLELERNLLLGTLPPEIGNLSKLVTLSLFRNWLAGTLPSEIGNLTNLEHLYLRENRLEGPLPQSLTSLENLSALGLSDTGLCAPQDAAFQTWLRGVTHVEGTVTCAKTDRDFLITLYDATGGDSWTNNTNWKSDRPISEWTGVTTDEDGRVIKLTLNDNNLSGEIPPALGSLEKLQSLFLYNNNLTGEIPPALGNLNELKTLILSSNPGLTGGVPPELGGLSKLVSLTLLGTGLSGWLPQSLTELTSLNSLNIRDTNLCAPGNEEFQTWLSGFRHSIPTCPDREELIALYDATGGDRWNSNTNWKSNKPIGEWHGVTVDAQGYVTKLELDTNDLRGTLPPEIGNLSKLVTLSLFYNRLTGPLPSELGNLTNLEHLYLDDNNLEGPLPRSLTSLENLSALDFSDTGLCAPQDSAFQTWLRGLTSVVGAATCAKSDRDFLITLYDATGGDNWREKANWKSNRPLGEWFGVTTDEDGRVIQLRLNDNNLTGEIPPVLGSLEKLQTLFLDNNNLTGGIPPALGNLNELTALLLSSNPGLTGGVPPELGGLSKLVSLNLSGTGLSGALPQSLTELTSLTGGLNIQGTKLCAPGNEEFQTWLSGFRYSIPTCPDREELIALYDATGGDSWTNSAYWKSNKPLGEWYGVTTDEDGRVIRLILNDNRMTGEIPPALGSMEKLRNLLLNNNNLTGQIPSALGNLNELKSLALSANPGLSGALPQSLTELTLTGGLNLQDTKLCAPGNEEFQTWLSGFRHSIPTCPDREELIALYDATGGDSWTNNTNWKSDRPISEWHGVTVDTDGRVTRLELERNLLLGTLPPEIGNLSKLVTLSLFRNWLAGTLPSEIGNLTNLEHLYLRENRLEGPLPQSLTSLENLSALGLSDTGLCAPQDAAFQTWLRGVTHVEGAVTCAKTDRDFLITLYDATGGDSWTNSAYWKSNRPLGEWYGVTTDEDGRVIRLILNDNNLSGEIPPALGSLEKLQILFLNNNNLTGQIPSALGNLNELTGLVLSANPGLSGALPQSLTELTLTGGLNIQGTKLCAPGNEEFQTWLSGLRVSGVAPTCPDREELIALYDATGGDRWNSNTNWKSDRPTGEWHGVTVDAQGYVTKLELDTNDLRGTLPPEIGNLSKLVTLSLFDNRLTGPLPSEIGNLSSLEHLYLDGNNLEGPLPRSLTSLENLSALDFSDTGLCAPQDSAFQTWLRGLTSVVGAATCAKSDIDFLITLYDATGGDNWTNSAYWKSNKPLGEWYGVTTDEDGRVIRLILNNNDMTGEIPPALGSLEKLQTLFLNNNNLTGRIPLALGNLNELTALVLSSNPGLSGALPQSLTELTSLTSLNLQDTKLCAPGNEEFQTWLSGFRHSIPTCAKTHRDFLITLYDATGGDNWTNSTNWKSNKPLGEWHGVVTDAYGRVTELNLQDNNLSGPIPADLGKLTELRRLILPDNGLSGPVPAWLGELGNLQRVNLEDNQLAGAIPAELAGASNLERIYLSGNDLEGRIPAALGQLSKLRILDLADNELTGEIPSELTKPENLEHLLLSNNRLTGRLPSGLDSLSGLKHLYLSHTDLSGPLPQRLTGLTDLAHLHFESSGLCAWPGQSFQAWLGRLESVGRNDNLCTDRDALEALYNATNGPNWQNNTNWLSDKPLGQWHGVKVDVYGRVIYLTLHNNGLSGPIPPELGNLSRLIVLNVAINGLSGPIPPELGDLGRLRHLTLLANNLSGPIPAELNKLDLAAVQFDPDSGLCIPPGVEFSGQLLTVINHLRGLSIERFRLPECGTSPETPRSQAPQTMEDRTALLVFYSATGGDSWNSSQNWGSYRPLGEWHGVVTDADGRVTELNLQDNNLSGRIPAELGSLSRLKKLGLHRNDLEGNVPTELGNLSSLESLYFSRNDLTGEIPSELSGLRNLKRLHINHTLFTGAVPSWLGDLSGLESLLFQSAGGLNGPLPQSLTKLGTLQRIHFQDTGLCAPSNEEFQTWLGGLKSVDNGSTCTSGQ